MRRHVIYWIIVIAIQTCVVLYDRELLPIVIVVTLMGVIGWLSSLRMISRSNKSAEAMREKDYTDRKMETGEDRHDRKSRTE